MLNIHDQTVVVTGAASGIGRALATTLHLHGARLILADKDGDALHEVAQRLDGQAVEMDVASAQDNDLLASVAGSTTLLCLNAGVISRATGPIWEASVDEWRRVLDINLGGVVNGLRSFIPRMLDDGQPHHILITASLAGLATWPGGGPYAASKHAVVAVAEQAALALVDEPISITLVCPALVRSGMSAVGDDPSDVAIEALDAVGRHRFLVAPDLWAPAIVARGHRLAHGEPPQLPKPLDAP